MALFFIASKNLQTTAVLFSSHAINSHCLRCCCCENFQCTRKIFLLTFVLLSILESHDVLPACHGVRRARRKVFREAIGAMLNFIPETQTSRGRKE